MTKPHHLLVFSEHLPQPKASAAGRRLNEILVLFSKAGFQITHIYSSDIQLFDEVELPLYQQLKLPINNQSVQAKLKALNPSYVLFDRFVMEEKWAWRIHDLFPEAVRILDLEDLHCLRKTREFCLKNKVKYSDDILKTQEISKRELASIVRSDLTLVISKFEYDLLINTFKIPEKQLFYLPFLTDSSSKTKALTFEERKDFIWIGGYKHPPNVDAVRYLKSSIWPKIRTELPKANLHIYGAYAPQLIQDFHNEKEGFLVKSWVDNAQDVISKARLSLAPLRFGAGLKGKCMEALELGTPVLASDIAIEGFSELEDWSGAYCADPEDYAKHAKRLYTSKSAWASAQAKAEDILESFSKTHFESRFIEKIKQLESFKPSDFWTQNLIYQSFRQSKYFSKWIEEKEGH